jgi:ABC-type antimicrobial peptide transport system permease subunit
VSEDFLNSTSLINRATTNVLIKTTSGVNGTALQEEFADYFDDLEQTYSVTSTLIDRYESPIQRGPLLIQWVAIIFAMILGLVSTSIVIILTLKEKDAEIALLTVRGFTKGQLAKTLFAEMMVMVFFSLLLGTFVGFIQIFGNVSLLNSSTGIPTLIRYRVVLGGMAGVTMLIVSGVVILAAAIPVWWASRRPERKVDVLRA